MPEEPELASADTIAALRALWLSVSFKYVPSTCSNTKRIPSSEPKRGSGKWAPGGPRAKWRGFDQVAAEYQLSEEKRKAARPWYNKPAEERKKRKIDAEDEHFERVFKEKGLGDPNYYGVR